MSDHEVLPADLSNLPGAPFTQTEIETAIATIRDAAGWHIAPVRTETAVLDVQPCEQWLRPPTRRLVAVTDIVDTDTDTSIFPSTWRASQILNQVRRVSGYWPAGYARVAITMTHGHDLFPTDLFGVVADAINIGRRDQQIRSVQVDDAQASFGASAAVTAHPLGQSAALARYSLDATAYGIGIA